MAVDINQLDSDGLRMYTDDGVYIRKGERKKGEPPHDVSIEFVLFELKEAKRLINQAMGNVKAKAFAAANTNIERAHKKLQTASEEIAGTYEPYRSGP